MDRAEAKPRPVIPFRAWIGPVLGHHPSQPFNPDVANTFFRSGDIEAWGRGIQRILGACRAAGTPEPRIEVDGRDFWFEFPFSAAYLDSLASGKGPSASRSSGAAREKPREKTRDKVLALIRNRRTHSARLLSISP